MRPSIGRKNFREVSQRFGSRKFARTGSTNAVNGAVEVGDKTSSKSGKPFYRNVREFLRGNLYLWNFSSRGSWNGNILHKIFNTFTFYPSRVLSIIPYHFKICTNYPPHEFNSEQSPTSPKTPWTTSYIVFRIIFAYQGVDVICHKKGVAAAEIYGLLPDPLLRKRKIDQEA